MNTDALHSIRHGRIMVEFQPMYDNGAYYVSISLDGSGVWLGLYKSLDSARESARTFLESRRNLDGADLVIDALAPVRK